MLPSFKYDNIDAFTSSLAPGIYSAHSEDMMLTGTFRVCYDGERMYEPISLYRFTDLPQCVIVKLGRPLGEI